MTDRSGVEVAGVYRAAMGMDEDYLPPGVRLHALQLEQFEDAQARVEARQRAAAAVDRADARLARCAVEAQSWAALTGKPFDPFNPLASYPSLAERMAFDDRIEFDAAVRDERKRAAAAGLLHLLDGYPGLEAGSA